MFLLPDISSSHEERKYVLYSRSFSDMLAHQRAYTLTCKVQYRAVGNISVGIRFAYAMRGRTHTHRQCWLWAQRRKESTMTTTAQDTITVVKTLLDLTNNHLSDPVWLDKSLSLFAEDCEVVDIPSGMTSRGPDGYKQI